MKNKLYFHFFFIRLGGAKRLGSEKQSPESDTDSMAEYGEGDTGIFFSSSSASILSYFVFKMSFTTPFITSLLYRLTITL